MGNVFPLAKASPLEALQEAFCLIALSGQVLLVDRQGFSKEHSVPESGSSQLYKRQEGLLLMKRFLENYPGQCDVKKTIDDFWVSPRTHVYTNIAFSPTPQPPTTLNYWIGPLITPEPGDWTPLRQHIQDVICSGDPLLYDYLIRYLAHMLQKPEDKPGVMVILLGGQGTGKGLFFQIVQRIWPKTSLLISDISQIVGRFNASLERNYVIIMDEAMFSGDRKSQDRMKSLISEKTIHIEQKHQPARSIGSVHRFFASSNQEHFSHVEADDRRSLFIRVSNSRQGNSAYFAELARAISDDRVIAAIIYELMNVDLAGFNVRQRPLTHEHAQQKLHSLKGFDHFWFEVLRTGEFVSLSAYSVAVRQAWKAGDVIPTDSLIEQYQRFDKGRQYKHMDSKVVADAMKRLCPSTKQARKSTSGNQKRGYVLPDLATARKEFEAHYKTSVDWEDTDPSAPESSSEPI